MSSIFNAEIGATNGAGLRRPATLANPFLTAPPDRAAPGTADGVRPNWWNAGATGWSAGAATASAGGAAGFFGLVAQLIQKAQSGIDTMLQNLLAAFNAPAAAPQATFQSADLSSTGDPHLALTGALQRADGSTHSLEARYDSMNGHADLLHSPDFGDAFQVATAVTTPDANGVTYNRSATATMNGGHDSVTLANDGALSIASDGQAFSLAPGGHLTLSGGETVARGVDGSVSIAEDNLSGETLATTFRSNGSGVDVTAHAAGGVTLGGDLVAHAVANAPSP